MILCGGDSRRDVVASPRVQTASGLMPKCPAPADPAALSELGITVTAQEDEAE